jgi:hypothetical protein
MSDNKKSAGQPLEAMKSDGLTEEDRRTGTRDRRVAKVDRRNSERLAEEIAPRRHPDVKGRRSSDR